MNLGPVIDVRLVRDRRGRWRVSVEGRQIVSGARTVAGAIADLLLALAAEPADPCPEPLCFETPETPQNGH